MARFRSVNGTICIRPSVMESTGASTLWRGSETQVRLLSDAIIDLGVILCRPAATVRRMGRSVCSSTTGPPVHWRCSSTFSPSFRRTRSRRLVLMGPQANGTRITDDQPEGGPTSSIAAPKTRRLSPRRACRCCVAQHAAASVRAAQLWRPIGGHRQDIQRQMWYRPRRASF